jgi:hypothetical protein
MSAFVQARQASSPQKPEQDQTTYLSDYQRTFPPCNLKDLAPVNRFAHKLVQSTSFSGSTQEHNAHGEWHDFSFSAAMASKLI